MAIFWVKWTESNRRVFDDKVRRWIISGKQTVGCLLCGKYFIRIYGVYLFCYLVELAGISLVVF